MAVKSILEFPDERLRTKAKPVENVDDNIRTLVDDMFETMYAAKGIGLAATQIDIHQRVVVMDVSTDKDQPLCLINPEIVEADGHQIYEEGCLSVPGIYAKVERANYVVLRAQDRDGATYEMEAEGLLAVCIQHELDHLEGKVFVDYLSALKRQMVMKKLAKQRRQDNDASAA